MEPNFSIVICKPQPNGAAEPPEYYFYAGSLSTVTRTTIDFIPKYVAIDDAPLPNQYVLPYEHGRMLEFRHVGVGIRRWVVFAQNGKIHVDDGKQHQLTRAAVGEFRFRRWWCLTHVRVHWSDTGQSEKFWVYTPILRLLFRDPVATKNECEPLIDMLSQLAISGGYDRWLQRWTSGIAHESTALKVLHRSN